MEEAQNKNYIYQDTTARKKIWQLTKRIRAVKGGTSASKTVSILSWHVDYCQQKFKSPQISTVASESYPHLDLGVIRDFKALMKDRGYWRDERWNATKSFYVFETGNILEFMSVDTYSKAHGPRRDTLFLNECNNLPWNIVDQLILRTRKIVWMDWNPTEEFWFHEQLLPYRSDEIDYITLTYKDNESLDDISIREIESHMHDKQWWNVYGLGQDGTIESRIYRNWNKIDDIPEEARLVARGLDFGYTNDPTAMVDVYKWNNAYILDEKLYEKGLMNSQIAKIIGKRDKTITIADSAEPKSIDEIAQYGVTIIGSTKGKGSISQGIDTVRSKKIYVTIHSLNILKEYRNYLFITDKNGKIINKPRDLFNHAMDATRYALSFLHPIDDDEETYVQQPYEKPGIRESSNMDYPQVTIGSPIKPGESRKERLAKIMAGRAHEEDDYETDTPWQRPGI